MSWPADWESLFDRVAPLIVEIGFGNGEFLVNLSSHHQHANVIGLEVSRPSIEKAERRIAAMSISNLRLIQGMAQSTLWLLFQPGQIASLYINFPDPWPKGGHFRRRLISERFLHLAATRMIPGATLDIATDHTEYAGWILDRLNRTPFFSSRIEESFQTDDEFRIQTKYEEKAVTAGKQCYYFKWRRVEDDPPDKFLIPKELPMPHVVVYTPLDLNQIAGEFRSNEIRAGDITIRFIELYVSQNYRTLVIDTFIREDWLDQRLVIGISEKDPNEYKIQLHEAGFPRATPGVHLAIRSLANWLIGLKESGLLLRHNLRDISEEKKRQ